jgi:hypothetical protein
MPGPTSRWDQHEDPRDNTVDLPRIDVDGLTDYFRRAAPMLEPEPAALLEPLPEQSSADPPEPDPRLARGTPYAPESRGYLMPDAGRPDDLRHPYAGPTDEPRRPSVWQAAKPPSREVPPIPAATRPSGLTTSASQPGTPNASGRNLAREAPAVAAGLAGEPRDRTAPESAPARPAAGEPQDRTAPESAPATPTAVATPPATVATPPATVATPPATVATPPAAVAADPDLSMRSAEASSLPLRSGRPAAATGTPGPSAGIGPVNRAPAGSLADLRTRLARLPDGHPSSPYEDDGHARPLPIRLKQLELGLPAPARELAAAVTPDVEADDVHADRAQSSAEPELHPPAVRLDRHVAGISGTGDIAKAELPPADASTTDARATDEPAAESGSESAVPSGPSPAHPNLADSSGGAGNDRTARHSAVHAAPGDLTLGPWQATPPPRVSGLEGIGPRGSNGHRPSNGHGTGSQRESPARPERPGRAPSGGDRRDTAQHQLTERPSADLRELVERTLATGRTAEGRNALGRYGSSGLTPAMQRLAAHLPFGGLAPGSEATSLKSPERLAAKLIRLIARNPGRTAEELAAAIGDVVRYAFAFETADYVEGTWLVHRRLKSHGFELEIRRNRWESSEYKGIFTQWRDPAHDVAFEVQFHTTASWAVLQRTYDAYVQITDPATPGAERARLRARQVTAAATAKAPQNWAEFDDFRLETR